jgi:hypothetical protein
MEETAALLNLLDGYQAALAPRLAELEDLTTMAHDLGLDSDEDVQVLIGTVRDNLQRSSEQASTLLEWLREAPKAG